MNKYKKVVKELIDKSFPRLKKRFVFVVSFPYQINWANAMVVYFGFMVWIVVFPVTKKYSSGEIKALLAHELSHYEIVVNMKFFELFKFGFKWVFTKKWKVWFETAADKYAIEKGYARGLFSRVVKIEKEKTKEYLKLRQGRGYLSSKQIKTYAKKIGKWQ